MNFRAMTTSMLLCAALAGSGAARADTSYDAYFNSGGDSWSQNYRWSTAFDAAPMNTSVQGKIGWSHGLVSDEAATGLLVGKASGEGPAGTVFKLKLDGRHGQQTQSVRVLLRVWGQTEEDVDLQVRSGLTLLTTGTRSVFSFAERSEDFYISVLGESISGSVSRSVLVSGELTATVNRGMVQLLADVYADIDSSSEATSRRSAGGASTRDDGTSSLRTSDTESIAWDLVALVNTSGAYGSSTTELPTVRGERWENPTPELTASRVWPAVQRRLSFGS